MKKTINLKDSIYDICNENPEIVDIMYGYGFHDIVKPGMLKTAGRFMTIPKGAAMKKLDLEVIKKDLINKGYEIIE